MSPLHTGDRLDDYRIEGVAARSGMASIFRAIDTRSGRQVAIKVPHAELESDPQFFDRFQREAEIGRQMDHPGITKVLNGDSQSRVYMVMEWAEGRLLRSELGENRKMSPERAVRIALNICDALDYVHCRGVVHRDLKPENIMLAADDRIKLIDFGIAAKVGARRLTFGKLSQLMGTPDYISPEQVEGKSGDARSDLYALGTILYEMLTGRTPFRGDTPFAAMNARLISNPIPPRELAPNVSPALQETIYRALERDPRKRYATAREFARDLQHPELIAVKDRSELREWAWPHKPWAERVLFGLKMAAIPGAIFSLLIYVARHT
jgi:serine/threonine-protein kinase